MLMGEDGERLSGSAAGTVRDCGSSCFWLDNVAVSGAESERDIGTGVDRASDGGE